MIWRVLNATHTNSRSCKCGKLRTWMLHMAVAETRVHTNS